MPHEKPYLDDYHVRHQAELQAQWDEHAKVFNVQNQAMRAVLNECSYPLRTPELCRECGNENCVKAYKEQNKIWGEDQSEPASVANTANINQAARTSHAQSKSPLTQKCPDPGQPVSGSGQNLFALMARLREDEDMAA